GRDCWACACISVILVNISASTRVILLNMVLLLVSKPRAAPARPDRENAPIIPAPEFDGTLRASSLRASEQQAPTFTSASSAPSDQHTVKPWLNGKVAVASPVHDRANDAIAVF